MKRTPKRAKRLDAAWLVSSWRASSASAEWLESIERAADLYLRANGKRPGAEYLRDAQRMARLARALLARLDGDGIAAVTVALGALHAAWLSEIAEARFIRAGAKSVAGADNANKKRGAAHAEQRDAWRAKAASIRERRPNLSATAIAKQIDKKRWNTVRKHISPK